MVLSSPLPLPLCAVGKELTGTSGTGNGAPGKYRVVTDYNDNFVGVMIEGAGASFTRCTVNSD